jgi:hypothetical protein
VCVSDASPPGQIFWRAFPWCREHRPSSRNIEYLHRGKRARGRRVVDRRPLVPIPRVYFRLPPHSLAV